MKSIPLNSWILIGIGSYLATLVGDLVYYWAIKKGCIRCIIIMSLAPLINYGLATIFLGHHRLEGYRSVLYYLGILLVSITRKIFNLIPKAKK